MNHKPNLNTILLALAVTLGIFVRLLQLGIQPLSNQEANAALQAFQIAQSRGADVITDPVYTVLTGAFFFLFGSTNFLARIWPAVAGISIIFLPIFLKKYLGDFPAILLAFGLALDPILTAASRQASSGMIALASLAWGLYWIWKRRYAGAGFMLGVGLLSGVSFWTGAVGMAAALLVGVVAFGGISIFREGPENTAAEQNPLTRFGIGILIAVLSVGVLFSLIPQGLAGLTSGFFGALRSLSSMKLFSAGQVFAGLIAYEIFPLLFGLAGFLYGWIRKNAEIKMLSIWFLAALLLAMFNPEQSFGTFVWLVLPIWIVTAWTISQWIHLSNMYRWVGNGLAALAFVLLSFGWINVLALIFSSSAQSQDTQIRAIALLGSVLLLLLIAILVGIGWNWRTAAWGASAGAALFLFLTTFSGLWHAAGFTSQPQNELWRPAPTAYQVQLLKKQIGDVSIWSTGRSDWLDVNCVGVSSPSLVWALRNLKNAAYLQSLATADKPSIIITPGTDQPALAAEYRGQKITWQQNPVWDEYSLSQWMRWLAFREAPGTTEDLILWVRSDLFLGTSPLENP